MIDKNGKKTHRGHKVGQSAYEVLGHLTNYVENYHTKVMEFYFNATTTA